MRIVTPVRPRLKLPESDFAHPASNTKSSASAMLGLPTYRQGRCHPYGNGNAAITHQKDSATGTSRVLDEASRLTPAILVENRGRLVDVGFMAAHDGGFRSVAASASGGMELQARPRPSPAMPVSHAWGLGRRPRASSTRRRWSERCRLRAPPTWPRQPAVLRHQVEESLTNSLRKFRVRFRPPEVPEVVGAHGDEHEPWPELGHAVISCVKQAPVSGVAELVQPVQNMLPVGGEPRQGQASQVLEHQSPWLDSSA
jgi:hypothetical protein